LIASAQARCGPLPASARRDVRVAAAVFVESEETTVAMAQLCFDGFVGFSCRSAANIAGADQLRLGLLAGDEVIGIDLVEELPELLHLVVFGFGNLDPGLVQHVLGTVDVGANTKRKGDRV
jgi:hypothetical protein